MQSRTAQDKRIYVAVLCLVALAIIFWTGSRYPALSEKAAMAADTPIAGIAFDILIEITPDTTFWTEVLANTVNWAYTNWKGMTFGVLFGAALATIISLVPRKGFDNPFSDAILGTAIGAPLGVCVNCASPVAQAMHDAGAHRATTLAALIASPTLNVIVVSMSFAVLPTYIAWTRLGLIFMILLVGIPLLCRLIPEKPRKQDLDLVCDIQAPKRSGWITRMLQERLRDHPGERVYGAKWTSATHWFIRRYFSNLFFVIVVTVPLMLVAGFLGALTVTAFPVQMFNSFQDSLGNGFEYVVIMMLLIAIIALILPVPIAFDVVLVAVLLASGWKVYYAMVALIALGAFSIYSFAIIGRAMSFRVAGGMVVIVFIAAVTGGLMAYFIAPYAQASNWRFVNNVLATAPQSTDVPLAQTAPIMPRADIAAALAAAPPAVPEPYTNADLRHDGAGRVSLAMAPLQSADAKTDQATQFDMQRGDSIGLVMENPLSTMRMLDALAYFNPIASGDVNGDGWDDIVIGADFNTGGAALFINTGGTFMRSSLDLGPLEDAYVVAIALVDLNTDGAADLFVSSIFEGAYVFWNDGNGHYASSRMASIPNPGTVAMVAPAFGDLDGDGDIDGFAGNWVGGHLTSFKSDNRAVDRIFWNENGRFETQDLGGVPGETLSTLITDVDGDGRPDILVGDDVSRDKVYLNKGNRAFALLRRDDQRIPWLGQSTMSLDTGDFDNDLVPDLYVAQVTHADIDPMRADGSEIRYCDPDMAHFHGETSSCAWTIRDRSNGFMEASPSRPKCHIATGPEARAFCAVRSTLMRAAKKATHLDCATLPRDWPLIPMFCRMVSNTSHVNDAALRHIEDDALPWLVDRNVLLRGGEAGTYADVAPQLGAKTPGWSWNAKFTDLDQDGWQDIFVATGYIVPNEHSPNAYYRNIGGQRFDHASAVFGLSDPIPTSAFVLTDFDRDGDVDMVRAPTAGHVIVHESAGAAGQGLWVTLADEIGNPHGIGGVVTIRTDSPTTPVQRREIKASGGFASFDAPRAHFGLGDAARVLSIEVTWADGAMSVFEGHLPAGADFYVKRQR